MLISSLTALDLVSIALDHTAKSAYNSRKSPFVSPKQMFELLAEDPWTNHLA